ncbi:Ca2-binding protein [Aureococcus anophagefferens]|nr:Ca2-binding protein [Aureococcus anophagefferens]
MRDDDLDFVVTHFLDPRGDVVYRDFVASVEAADGGDGEPAAPGAAPPDARRRRRAAGRAQGAATPRVLSLGCRRRRISTLENRYRAATRGGVHYVELLNGVLPVRPEAGEAWRVEEKLRAMIKRRFEWWQPGRLRRAFKHFDTKRRGRVDAADLADGLRALKLKLSGEQERDLFAAMDLDGDGWVEYRSSWSSSGPVPRVPGAEARPAARPTRPGPPALRSAIDRLAGAPRRADYARVFDDFDADGSGKLEPREFKRALKALGFEDLGADDVRDAVAAFDGDGDGKVDFREFVAFATGGGREDEERTNRVERALRKELERLGGSKKLRRAFEDMDANGSGKLSRRELGRALDDLGFRLDRADVDALMARFDRDGDGKVSWKEFVAFADGGGAALLEGDVDDGDARDPPGVAAVKREVKRLAKSRDGPPDRELRKSTDARVIDSARDLRRSLEAMDIEITRDEAADEVRRLARGRRNRLRDAFLEFDDNDSGKINKREFRRALERLGFELSADDVDGLVDRFDVDGDGKVSYAEFVGWCDRGAGAGAREEDQDDVLKLLRDACRDRLDGGSSPRAVFERLDRDGDGTVDEDEFARGCGSSAELAPTSSAPQRRSRAPDYRRAFRDLDADGSGRLERREFRRGLEKLGFEFDGGEFDRVVERLDRDGDGTVSLREFLKFAEGAGSRPEDSDDAVDEVMGRLRGLVRDAVQDGLSPADCFEHFDRDGAAATAEFTKG